MDIILNFLTKQLVDEAVAIIDGNGIPPKREGKGFAVAIGDKQYRYKLIVTEAAKIAGVNLTTNDFGSSKANRKGFQEITGCGYFGSICATYFGQTVPVIPFLMVPISGLICAT